MERSTSRQRQSQLEKATLAEVEAVIRRMRERLNRPHTPSHASCQEALDFVDQIAKLMNPFTQRWKGPINLPLRILEYCSVRPYQLGLTFQEKRIAYAVSLGFSDREIAAELDINDQTVKQHISKVKKKAGLKAGRRSRVHLVLWYLEPLILR